MNRTELKKKIKLFAIELLKEKEYVSSIDLLLKLNYLAQSDHEKWRFGEIEFLEKACTANLSKLNFIGNNLKAISKELNLKESSTAYMKFGKGSKMKLRFSKSNDENIEKRYSTHYVI